MVNISEKISALRKTHNMTQEALGEAVGVSAQAVSKWEKGDSLPDISVIPDICRVFGISADALLGSEGNMTSEIYVDKALKLCKGLDERMRLLRKFMPFDPDRVMDTSGELEKKSLRSMWSEAHIYAIDDGRGFGMFFSDIAYVKNMMSVDLTKSALLKFISDEKTLKIFSLICTNGRLSESEIIKLTGFTEHEVTERLFAFMKNSLIQSVMDTESQIKEMAYAISQNGILLLGIMANIYLFEPASGKGLISHSSWSNCDPNKLRKFVD